MVKRKLALLAFILIFFLTGILPTGAQEEEEIETTAESALLMEYTSGQILYQKNPHKRLPPASMTKVMTMLLAVEAVEQGRVKLSDMVTASENAWEMGGSEIFLAPQEKMSFRDLLIAIAVESANDACVAVAEHLAGSEKAFVRMMNKKAQELGLKNTHFVNSHGLPAKNHYTSAYDMAVLFREAFRHPLFREVSKIKEYELRGGKNKLYNTNKLLWWYDGADGGKTGWTEEAKYCLTSTVKRDGLRLIAVVMGVPEARGNFRESMKLYNWGFARFEAIPVKEKGAYVARLPVNQGIKEQVEAVAEDDIAVLVTKGEDVAIRTKINLVSSVTAPVPKGKKVGEILVFRKGKLIAKGNVVTGEAVARDTLAGQMKEMVYRLFTFARLPATP